jgi:putative photosynthetic complex assembly protein
MTTALRHDRDPLRKPMTAIGVMLAVIVLLVAGVRIERAINGPAATQSPVVAELSFTVKDDPDGTARLIDTRSGREIDVIAPDSENFFRTIRQIMLRERKRAGGGEERLILRRRADGVVEFTEEASGFTLDVRGFGSQNGRFFSELLIRESTTP